MKNTAVSYINEKSQELMDLSKKIWDQPELAFEEVYSSKLLADYLKDEGFEVELNYAKLPTAFRASWGSGKPIIGFLGEYDALPGMSQKVSGKKEAIREGAPGHACQHNLLGVAHLAAAIGLKKELEEKNLSGTIVFYGCPAEETLTGKGFMAREGAFRELDLSFAWHPGASNMVSLGSMAAMNTAKFHFKGITAHAGADPHNGRSALDAVELMNVGANYLREHVTDDVRIHYTITNGGLAPNIVPDKASVWYYVRALSREAVEDTYVRLLKVANGAAMMTETEVEVEFMGGCYNTMQNKVLVELVHEAMETVERPRWTEEELEFAEGLNAGLGKGSAGLDKADSSLKSTVDPVSTIEMYSSTDVGDVQHIAPGVTFLTVTSNSEAAGHSWHNTACGGHSIGHKGMLYGAKVMALAAMKIYEEPGIAEAAKKEFEQTMVGQDYVCPMEGIQLPV